MVYSVLEASTVSGSLVWWLIWSVKIKLPFFLCTVLWRKNGHVGKAQHVHGLTCRCTCLVNFLAAITLLSEKNILAPIWNKVGGAICDKTNKESAELTVASYSVHRAQFIVYVGWSCSAQLVFWRCQVCNSSAIPTLVTEDFFVFP
jgi:hypothetical protein